MPSMTIRDVPQETRDVLAERAKASGRSLQEFMRLELIALAEREERRAWIDRVAEHRKGIPEISTAEILETLDEIRRP